MERAADVAVAQANHLQVARRFTLLRRTYGVGVAIVLVAAGVFVVVTGETGVPVAEPTPGAVLQRFRPLVLHPVKRDEDELAGTAVAGHWPSPVVLVGPVDANGCPAAMVTADPARAVAAPS